MMRACLRTAGCPAAERNLLTGPTAGATPDFAPLGVESPLPSAQHRCPRKGGRAVPLTRRRLARDDFLGVRGNLHSHCSERTNGRPSIDVWCDLPVGLTPVCRRIRLHPFAERQAAVGREKNWRNSVTSEVRPLDFGDHIEVRPAPSVLSRRTLRKTLPVRIQRLNATDNALRPYCDGKGRRTLRTYPRLGIGDPPHRHDDPLLLGEVA